jgi:hypothetical protein
METCSLRSAHTTAETIGAEFSHVAILDAHAQQGIDVEAIQHELRCTQLQLQETEAANAALKQEMAEAKKATVAAQREAAHQAAIAAAAQTSAVRCQQEASDARVALAAAHTELDALKV